MDSLWTAAGAGRCQTDLALCAYASRLLGSDPALVLHGGGNTSIKCDAPEGRVLHVKGTGSDLARVRERDFTPLQLDGVLQVLRHDGLDNDGMRRRLESCVVRRPAPAPSIETLLHAGLPYRCVAHTHADAVLAAMNVDEIDAVHAEVYGDVAPLVPYHHSGHALARACMATFAAQRGAHTIGLILAFHGVVAFADDARTAYERMLQLVTRAENYLKTRNAWTLASAAPAPSVGSARALRPLRAAIDATAGAPMRMRVISDAQCLAFARRTDLADITQQGPATPQHAVYTKRVPLLTRDVTGYAAAYRGYLDKYLGATASARIDAAPRILLDPQFGLCAFGKTARSAQIAARMYRHDIDIISRASAHGRYRAAPPAAMAQAEYEYGGFAKADA